MYDSIAQNPGFITDESYHFHKKKSSRTYIVQSKFKL
jgi:hypothetical protein